MKKHFILGVHITDRLKNAVEVQKLFTEFGCHIKTRVGLHDVKDDFCSSRGVVVLELVGDENRCQELADKLHQIEGVEVQKMVFDHSGNPGTSCC